MTDNHANEPETRSVSDERASVVAANHHARP